MKQVFFTGAIPIQICMPKYTLAGRGDDCAGGKEQKQRITALLLVNGTGTDCSIVLVGKSNTPTGTNQEFWTRLNILVTKMRG
jgi:hypothetical protein